MDEREGFIADVYDALTGSPGWKDMLLLIVYDEHGGIFDHVFPPSLARAQNVIPFYMQPTLGGSDIDSVVGLRGFDNYRFRAPDAMFLQAEYDHPFGDQSEV